MAEKPVQIDGYDDNNSTSARATFSFSDLSNLKKIPEYLVYRGVSVPEGVSLLVNQKIAEYHDKVFSRIEPYAVFESRVMLDFMIESIVAGYEEGKKQSKNIQQMIDNAYERGYRNGYDSCNKVRDSLERWDKG